MARCAQIPLVGPGSELQLTLDGRAVPHAEVVAANPGTAAAAAVAPRTDGADGGPAPGQTRLA